MSATIYLAKIPDDFYFDETNVEDLVKNTISVNRLNELLGILRQRKALDRSDQTDFHKLVFALIPNFIKHEVYIGGWVDSIVLMTDEVMKKLQN